MGSIEAPVSGIRISIDRGGTFTDCVATVPGQSDIVIKLLSVDPDHYPDAPVEAIRRVLEQATRKSYPPGQKISLRGVGKDPGADQKSFRNGLSLMNDRINQNGYYGGH